MTVSLLAFLPVAILFLVAASCFVGCQVISGLDDLSVTDAFTDYSRTDVRGNRDCVAYWPLNDKEPMDKAKPSPAPDIVGQQNGEYRNMLTDPTLYKCPDFEINATTHSAEALGEQTIGAAGIVPGDLVDPQDPSSAKTAAMWVSGGFVTVPANGVTNPPAPFSVELWVRPEWKKEDVKAHRMLIDSRDAQGPMQDQLSGFGIWVTDDGNWQATIGVAGKGSYVLVTGLEASLGVVSHIVLTHDGAEAQLFVNGQPASGKIPASGFVPNTTQPLTIGVGGARFGNRSAGGPEPKFPFFPFMGTIQCVAIYGTNLDPATIATHTKHGNGEA